MAVAPGALDGKVSMRHRIPGVVLACVFACAVVAPWPGGRLRAQRLLLGPGVIIAGDEAPGDEEGSRPLPMINIDDELGGFLKRAAELIADKQYVQAIEILDALLERTDQPFVPTADVRRFVSLSARTSEVIGALPPDALAMYRRTFDAKADRMFTRAARVCDESALREVIRLYRHTRSGDDALNLLGAIQFDRGEFSQAAGQWRAILRTCRDSQLSGAVLLAKIAVAHHYARQPRSVQEALAELASGHAQAEAELAGRRQNVLEFARGVLALPPPASAGAMTTVAGWPSMAGAPDSIAVMKPCRPVLSQRWVGPGGKVERNPIVQLLVGPARRLPSNYSSSSRQTYKSVGLREGHVVLTTVQGNKKIPITLPPVIHPIVVGKHVLYRTDRRVVAHDLLTGKLEWQSVDFPVFEARNLSGVRTAYSSYGSAMADKGRLTLSAGDGMVFAVGRFLPPNMRYIYTRSGQRNRLMDTSVLAAFSTSSQLRLLWRVGGGKGSDKIVRACKFLCAPTYSAGRLYVVAAYMQAYHLLCLDANNGGKLLWSAMVGQQPIYNNRYMYRNKVTDRGSPPAVAGGRVYAVTNAGVAAAFEADTGRALWAYQYSIAPASQVTPRSYKTPPKKRPYPPNPIVIARGRAVFLPADSDKLLVLRADTGELVPGGSIDRRDQANLTALDETRMVLSGEQLLVVDVTSGQVREFPLPDGGKIIGRPAVTEDAVLASANGRLVRLSLPDMVLRRGAGLGDKDGLLGNLVSVDNKLIAANAAGVAAYFPYGSFRAELSRRLATADPEQVPDLLYRRGMNAFNANRPAEGLPDLISARTRAERLGQGELIARTDQALYRTYISMANRAATDARMNELFAKATAHAYSVCSRGEMVVRAVKFHVRVGQYPRAVALAHKLAEEYEDTELVDVDISDAADPYVRDDPDTPRSFGRQLGQRLIGQMITRHGQGVYAAFDAQAQAELDAGVTAAGAAALIRVTDTYPHSKWAALALLRAAEAHFARVAGGDGERQRDALISSGRALLRLSAEYPASELAPSAHFGRTLIYRRLNSGAFWPLVNDLRGLPPDTSVSFAGVKGTLRDTLRRFPPSSARPKPAAPFIGRVAPPVTKLYADEQMGLVLRDKDGMPIRWEGKLFVLKWPELLVVDPKADDMAAAIQWRLKLPLPPDRKALVRYGFSGWQYTLLGGLSVDGSKLAIGSRSGILAVDLKTRAVSWQIKAGDGRLSDMHSMVVGSDRFVLLTRSGGVHVLDIRTGKLLWAHNLPQQELYWRTPPQLAGGLLLTTHGRTQLKATVFDLIGKRSLGSVPLTNTYSQACLTPDGMLLVNNGKSLDLIEPVLSIDQPLWSVKLSQHLRPAILAVTDDSVILSPSQHSGVLQVRSLTGPGQPVQSLSMVAGPAGKSIPYRAWVRGGRLYVLGSRSAASYRHNALNGHMAYAASPSLQAFDLKAGTRLWRQDLTGNAQRKYSFVMPLEIGRDHVAVLVKYQPYTEGSQISIFRINDGTAVQRIRLPGIKPIKGRRDEMIKYTMVAGPVMVSGRLVLETPKGIEVHGGKD